MYENLAVIAVFVFLYSIVSAKLEKTSFSGAILFTGFGLALGPTGLGVLELDVDAELLRTLAELTLALVLFTILGMALGFVPTHLREEHNMILRTILT